MNLAPLSLLILLPGLILTSTAYVRFLLLAHKTPAGSVPLIEAAMKVRREVTSALTPVGRFVSVIDIATILLLAVAAKTGAVSIPLAAAVAFAALLSPLASRLARALALAALSRVAHSSSKSPEEGATLTRNVAISIAVAVAGPAALLFGLLLLVDLERGELWKNIFLVVIYILLTRQLASFAVLKRLPLNEATDPARDILSLGVIAEIGSALGAGASMMVSLFIQRDSTWAALLLPPTLIAVFLYLLSVRLIRRATDKIRAF